MNELEKLGSVQSKVSCIFKTKVIQEETKKRKYQGFKVVASSEVKPEIFEHDIGSSITSEKVDGTCCLIQTWDGKPWLWPRLDRKLNKVADRKFHKFQILHRQWKNNGENGDEPTFSWKIEDFKEVPSTWEPALGVTVKNGIPQADANGHIPGWLPIEPGSRQYCWHLSPVDLTSHLAIILRQHEDGLEVASVALESLLGHTVELIGTNINGNPYGIGNKESPIHVLLVHGSVGTDELPNVDYDSIKNWFDTPQGGVEGIVWHCRDGTLFKIHRHHLGIKWPIAEPRLSQIPVRINVPIDGCDSIQEDNDLFARLHSVHGQIFPNIRAINV